MFNILKEVFYLCVEIVSVFFLVASTILIVSLFGYYLGQILGIMFRPIWRSLVTYWYSLL